MNLGPTELLIIAGVLVLLFGATKLPKLARSMGESARIFKAETKGLRDDEKAADSETDTDGKATDGKATDSKATGEQARQLPESTQQQEPLVAETVDESDTERKKAS